jgi:hypothetical protein
MENIRTIPRARLAIGALILAVIALWLNNAAPRGPTCAEPPIAQPGFSSASPSVQPACIRIRLR